MDLGWTSRPTPSALAALDPREWEATKHAPSAPGADPPGPPGAAAADPAVVALFDTAETVRRKRCRPPLVRQASQGRTPSCAWPTSARGTRSTSPSPSTRGPRGPRGDHPKSASDLGIPFVAVGLLYQHGYYIRSSAATGPRERSTRPTTRPPCRSWTPARSSCPGREVRARVWRMVGRIPVYLLDTNLPARPAPTGMTEGLQGRPRPGPAAGPAGVGGMLLDMGGPDRGAPQRGACGSPTGAHAPTRRGAPPSSGPGSRPAACSPPHPGPRRPTATRRPSSRNLALSSRSGSRQETFADLAGAPGIARPCMTVLGLRTTIASTASAASTGGLAGRCGPVRTTTACRGGADRLRHQRHPRAHPAGAQPRSSTAADSR